MAGSFNYRNGYIMVWKTDSRNRAAGVVENPDSVSTGSTVVSGALLLPIIIDSQGMAVTRAIYTEKGGGEIHQQIDGGVDSVAPFTVNLSRRVRALYAAMSGAKSVNVDTEGEVVEGGFDIAPGVLNNVGVAIITNTSVQTPTGYKPGKWTAKIYPLCQISPGDPATNQNTGDNPMPETITITPSKSKRAPWATPLTGFGYANNEAFMHPWEGDSPLYIAVAWMADEATTFTLPLLPKHSDAATTGKNIATKNGTRTAVTSINTTTGVVTLATAAAADDMWIIAYPAALPITAP